IFTTLSIILLALTFTMESKVAAVITVLVWGAFAFGSVPGLQVYVVQLAEKFTPNAVDVASGLNIAAFNIGIALGSIIGGTIVDGMELSDTAWIGALITVIALVVTRYSGHLDKRSLATSNKA
ncbi:MFS sugar transporter, partial [Alteromonas sp. 14N.309.X.WAT.G.H12]